LFSGRSSPSLPSTSRQVGASLVLVLPPSFSLPGSFRYSWTEDPHSESLDFCGKPFHLPLFLFPFGPPSTSPSFSQAGDVDLFRPQDSLSPRPAFSGNVCGIPSGFFSPLVTIAARVSFLVSTLRRCFPLTCISPPPIKCSHLTPLSCIISRVPVCIVETERNLLGHIGF